VGPARSGRLLDDVCKYQMVATDIEIIVVEVFLAAGLHAFSPDLARARLVPGIAGGARREEAVGEDQEVGVDTLHATDGGALLRIESQRCERRFQVLLQCRVAQCDVRRGNRLRPRLRCCRRKLALLLPIAIAYLVYLW